MKVNIIIYKILFVLILYSWVSISFAQNVNRENRKDFQKNKQRKIMRIPDIQGYLTLKGDFHVHTVFSDGSVWPDVRVEEAWSEGLDVIAITDHIEYRPHKAMLPDDLNSGYENAKTKAEELNILLIPGAEITKGTPPGHLNVLFVKDVNKLISEDPMIQIKEAINQGAFILWNHPGWGWARPLPDTTKWWDFQTSLLEKRWLHGIEVFNTEEWYPIALKWCKEKELTVFANTDIHTPINSWYDLSNPLNHRPLTLVFVNERSIEGVKEALFAKRTIGFFGDTFVGNEELIKALFRASVILYPPFRHTSQNGIITYYAEFENPTDLTFILHKIGDWKKNDRTDFVELLPGSKTIINYSEGQNQLEYQLTNCYYDINKHPTIQIPILKN